VVEVGSVTEANLKQNCSFCKLMHLQKGQQSRMGLEECELERLQLLPHQKKDFLRLYVVAFSSTPTDRVD